MILHCRLGASPPGSDLDLRGFFVTLFVNAGDLVEAGAAAIRLLQSEPKFEGLVTAYGEAPEIAIDEAAPVGNVELDAKNRTGYVFYEDD